MHNNYVRGRPPKSHLVALLLSVFLGGFGIDRFYLGHTWLGIAKLAINWGTLGVWWAIDVVLIALRKVDATHFVWDDEPNGRFQR
jgi:TM2 domain-containing membrane protein YozV